MKSKHISFIAIIFSFILLTPFIFGNREELHAQKSLDKLQGVTNPTYQQLTDALDNYYNNIPADQRRMKPYLRWKNFWTTRLTPDGKFPNGIQILNEWMSRKQKRGESLQSSNVWKQMGPFNNPQGSSGIGRVNVVRVNPSNDNEIWIGTASGGLWKSTDAGKSWTTFPFTQFLSMGIGDIAFSQSNPKIVYVGTGDPEESGTPTYSIGVIKTSDGGANWQTTNLSYDLSNGVMIGRVLVDPKNPNIVIIATNQGIMKTVDGGNTWTNKMGGYFRDMEFKRDDPNTMIASTYSWGGQAAIYNSTDEGDHWTLATSIPGARRIAMDVGIENTSVMYAVACSTGLTNFLALYKSTDAGKTWQMITNSQTAPNILGRENGNDYSSQGQGWYDLCIAVSPASDNEIFVGGINIWHSYDGGQTWNMVAHWYGGFNKPYVHADQHDLTFNINTGDLYSGNDGGIDVTTDFGGSWVNLNNNIDITQFYSCASAQTDSSIIYNGAQDNGSSMYKSGDWRGVSGGDGMDCAVDPTNSLTAYVSMPNGDLLRTQSGTGFSFMLSSTSGPNQTHENGNWVTPFVIDPNNPSTLYAGYINVWKTNNWGSSWTKVSSLSNGYPMKCIAVAPSDSKTVYVSNGSAIWYSHDAGSSWNAISGTPGTITGIAVNATNPNIFYVSSGGFSNGVKVNMYNGTKWTGLSGNMPNVPVNCIVYQKNSPDRLYVGTDIGVFYSDYNSGDWQIYGSGLPNVIVDDLDIQYSSHKLRAATYGRGLWETDVLQCNLPQPQITVNGNVNLCKGDSLTLSLNGQYNDFVWSTGEKTPNIVVKDAGFYYVTIHDPSGCTAHSESVNVTLSTTPQLSIFPVGKYPVCVGDTVNLTLNASLGFSSYDWSTGETTRSIKVTKPGDYSVTGQTSNGCSTTAILSVQYQPLPAKPEITRVSPTILKASQGSDYQWFLNDTLVPGATKQQISMKALGSYSVTVYDSSGCGTTSDQYDIVSDVGQESTIGNFINVYPNPNDGNFILSFSSPIVAPLNVTVKNILGIEVLDKTVDYTGGLYTDSMNLNQLPAGIYFLSVQCGNSMSVDKIIKK